MNNLSRVITLTVCIVSALYLTVSVRGIKALNPSSSLHELWEMGRGRVGQTVWSPDGNMLAVVGGYTIWLYNNQLEDVASLRGHTKNISSIDWKPDSRQIVSGSQDGTLRIWDGQSGQMLRIIQISQEYVSRIISAKWSPDGKFIASIGRDDRSIQIWEAATGNLVATLFGHEDDVSAIAWKPDGTQIASSGFDNTLRFWDTQTFQALIHFDLEDAAHSLVWNSNGQLLLSYFDSIAVWGTANSTSVAQLELQYRVILVDWRSNNEVYILSEDDANNTNNGVISSWNTLSGESKVVFAGERFRWATSWNFKDERLLVVDGESNLYLVDLNTGEVLHTLNIHHNEITSLAWSPNGSRIASGHKSGKVLIWDAQVFGPALAVLDIGDGDATSLAWSPDSSQLAATGTGLDVYIWDISSNEVNQILDATDVVAWSPDGTRLAIGQKDREGVQLWSATTWESTAVVGVGPTISLAWSPDGDRLAVNNFAITIYDADSLEPIVQMGGGYGRTLTWSPDGKQIIYSGPFEGPSIPILWDAITGEALRYLEGGNYFTWRPDGRLIASALGFSIYITDIDTYLVSTISSPVSISELKWSPNGSYLASGGDDFTIRIWGE